MNRPIQTETGLRVSRREIATFAAAAFLVRLAYLIAIGRVIDMADAIHYIHMGQQFAAGEFLRFDENLPVLYSALGALTHLVIPHWEWAFWTVSLVASALTLVPVYLIAHTLHGRTSARVAAVMVVLWPWLVDYGSRIAPEALAVCLWFTSVWLVYRAVERGGAAILGAGAALFALHLTRPEGTFLMLAAPVGGFMLAYGQGEGRMRRVAATTVLCLVALGLYALAMRHVVGTYTVSYRAPMAGDLMDYFRRGSIEGARTFLRLFSDEFPVMLGPILLACLGIGVYDDWPPKRPRLVLLLLLFCAVQWALTVANFSPAPRYIMAVVIVASLWSARGLVAVGERLRPWRPWAERAPVSVVAASFVVGLAANVAPQFLGDAPRLPREYKMAGEWMGEHLEPGYIICRKPQIGFYADMPTVGPALSDSPADVVERAKEIGARYLVVDERYTAQMAPGLRPLLDPAEAPPELRLLRADVSPYGGARVVIYEFVSPDIEYARRADFPGPSSHMGPDRRRRILHVE